MMFEFEMEKLAIRSGAEATLKLKFQALDLLRPVLLKYNAIPLEDVLYVFKSPSDALAASFAAKQTIALFNAQNRALKKDELNISGFGMHTGTIVFVEGTDIHWGDPVNTSSKLGQDIAQEGIVLISKIVKDGIEAERLHDKGTSTKRSPFTRATNKEDEENDGATTTIDLEYKHQIVTVSKVDLDCYGVTPSGDILIPSGSDEDGEGQRGEEAGEEEKDKVVLFASTGVQDVSWHPSAEAAKEEENINATPETPANTPARPNIPWLRNTMSPSKAGTSGVKLTKRPSSMSKGTTKTGTTKTGTTKTGKASRALATKTYESVPNISYDNGWSAAQKKNMVSTFGRQDSPERAPEVKRGRSAAGGRRRRSPSGALGIHNGIHNKRRKPPKERESVLTQQRKALSLANDVINDLEIANLKKEKAQMNKDKQKWHQQLISSSLYGSPKMKASINKMTKQMNAKRPGSASRSSYQFKPRRPTKKGNRQRKRPSSTQGGRRGRHMKQPQVANGGRLGGGNSGDSRMLLDNDKFQQFVQNEYNMKKEAINTDDEYNPTRYEASLKMKANDARMALLEAQNTADAAKARMWGHDKSSDSAKFREITIQIAKTQKILSLCNKRAEKTHRLWLIEMTRNARAITHADVDRTAPPQLPEEELKNAKLSMLQKRSDDASEEHRQAMNLYLASLTNGRSSNDNKTLEESVTQFGQDLRNTVSTGLEDLPDASVYLERAKKLRLMKKTQGAFFFVVVVRGWSMTHFLSCFLLLFSSRLNPTSCTRGTTTKVRT